MKYRMETLDEFVKKATALGVREVFTTQKLSQQVVEIPGPRPAELHPEAVVPTMKVLQLSGYLLLTARGKEIINGVEKLSEEFIFFIESTPTAVVKNDTEAKAFTDAVSKRQDELKDILAVEIGQTLMGEIVP